MEPSLYKYIFRNSAGGQLLVVGLSLLTLPITYLSLEVPKEIINSGIEGKGVPERLAGTEITQVQYLLLLCAVFLALVFLIGGLKYVINVYKGVLGERLLRRLRYQLYTRLLRFRLPEFRQVSQGELIAMITAETEPLGEFMGDSAATPALQGGMLLTYLAFIFNQDPFLGLAAIALYPVQMYLVPKLQRRINVLSRERVRTVRRMSERIGEGISGIAEVHAHGTSRYERADIDARLGRIFSIRFDIYKRKFFIKFMNNFMASLTPFFFYSIGGYFVIRGDLSIGALVAVLAAYKDLNPPWKEVLKYYQKKEDMRVKYDQIIDRFQMPEVLDERLVEAEDPAVLDGDLVVNKVSLVQDGSIKVLDNVSFTVGPQEHVAVTGPSGSGKDALGRLLGRHELPTSGHIRLGQHNLAVVPEPTLARQVGYVAHGAFIFASSVRENLLYGLKRRPPAAADGSQTAEMAGHAADDVEADWVDYEAAGLADPEALQVRLLAVLDVVGLSEDIYRWGLNIRLGERGSPEFRDKVLEARRRLRERISGTAAAKWVEPFDETAYSANATVAENLVFGAPADREIAFETLARDPYLAEVLRKASLDDTMVELGRQVAQTMVELFADLPEDHEFFEQFSFVRPEDLPGYRTLLGRVAGRAASQMTGDDRQQLLALAFKLIPARHRLGLIDEAMQERILEARRIFARDLPARLRDKIAFFDSERYNPAASIQDNILFGKIVSAQAEAQNRIAALLEEVVEELSLREDIARVGLDYQVGTAGGRLSYAQRQKLAIGRCLLKRPHTLIMNEATSALDAKAEEQILAGVREEMGGGRLICVLERAAMAECFDRVFVVDRGALAEASAAEAASTAETAAAGAEGRSLSAAKGAGE